MCAQSGESAMALTRQQASIAAIEFSVSMPRMATPIKVKKPGTLRGVDATTQGRERKCVVEVTTLPVEPDELTTPFHRFVGVRVVDQDNDPDGKYEVTFDGRMEPQVRRNGQYFEN